MKKIVDCIIIKSHFITSAMVAGLLLTPVANAAVVYFDDRAVFDATVGTGTIEDFQEANINVGGIEGTSNPLTEFTNDTVISPGDIASGLSISASNSSNAVVILGAGAAGNASTAAAADIFADSIVLTFDNGQDAVGFDIYGIFGSDTVEISLFDFNDALIETAYANIGAVGVSTFFGFSSDTDLITRIDINSISGGAEVIDNISFDLALAPVPEPATVALLALGLAGLGFTRRKKLAA